jgi:5-methylcytosine-specific restriction protein A
MAKNINDLSSRDAVIAAIKECDELGRDAFLALYGYKRARKYSLIYRKREYDSKAIAGVAYGKQFGTPMTPYDFIGGVKGALPPLLKLGFKFRDVDDTGALSSVSESSGKNSAWKRDELMLALHLYLHNRQSPPSRQAQKWLSFRNCSARCLNILRSARHTGTLPVST